jgi:DNA-directed RNA polymerase specialized sigma24 family protein
MSSTWSTDCRTVDPAELESRYSTDDNIEFLEQVLAEEPSEESLGNLERVREIMEELPAREADFVDLYFFNHKTQTDIAEIFKVSQPTVCYRLQRATARIRFVLSLPEVTEYEMEDALDGFLTDSEDVKIMLLMWETTCQSAVAKRLQVTQGKVRHRFMRSTKKMTESDRPGMGKYAKIFNAIAENLNILREVDRPAWDEKVHRVID